MRRLLRRQGAAKSDIVTDQLRICVVSARGLRAPSKAPFVVLRCGGLELRTAGARSSAAAGSQDDATWNETVIFKLPANSLHAWSVDIDVWNEGVTEFWSEGLVSLNEYLGSIRIDDAADPTAVRRPGVRSMRRPLTFRLALPTPQLGELAPVQCGELLLELHYARADELIDPSASDTAVDSPSGSALSSPRLGPSSAQVQQQHLINQHQAQLAASLAASGSASASATPVSSAPHRKMTLSTVALFRTCGLCNEVCWGVALQAYTCGDCHTAFHRRCQQAAALQTVCTPLEKNNRSSKIKAAKQMDLYDVPKKRKRLDKCLQEIAAESHLSVERMLEFMTWVASAYDQFNGEALFAVLHAKPLSAGVMPAVVESLASRDIFTRLVVIQVLQQLLYLESNKVALIAKGGISLLLQSLRDLQMYFLNSVSLTAANAGGGGVVLNSSGINNNNNSNNNNNNSNNISNSSNSNNNNNSNKDNSASSSSGSGSGTSGNTPMPGAPGSPQYNAFTRAALSPRTRRLTTPPRELNMSAVNAAGSQTRDDSTVISPFYEQYIQHTLAVLVFLANEESRAAFEREDALDTLLQLCRFTTNNQVLRYCLGALLIQFTDDEDAWRRIVSDPQQEAVRIVLAAAESGVATLHREIRPSEVTLERSLFQSPLCEVVAGRWKGVEVAVKVFDVNSIAWSWDSFFSELAMLAISQHANVVRLYGAHSRRTSLRPFIVMELASGTVADMIESLVARGGRCMLTTALAVHVGAEIAFGLAFLHQRGLIHRDVKSANFLVTEAGNVKFIDFGVSRMQSRGMLLNTAVGTPVWMAPEVLRGKGYGSKADIFSFALVLSHLLTGYEPFHDVPPLLVGDRVVNGLRPTLPRSVIAPLRGLVTRCWSTNEAERLPAADIVRQLDEIRRTQRDLPPPITQLPTAVQSALFQRCSFLMLCQLAQTCSSLRNSVRAFRINSLVPLDSLGLSLEAQYDATLRSYAWYHGNLSKQEATAMLRSMPAGVFLVRASSLPNHFVLCGQLEKQLLQILVTPVKAPSVGYTIDIEGDKRVYPTMVKLLKMYRHVLKHAILRPVWEPRATVPTFALADAFRLAHAAMKPAPVTAPTAAANRLQALPNLGTDDVDVNSGHFSPRARKLASVRPPQRD